MMLLSFFAVALACALLFNNINKSTETGHSDKGKPVCEAKRPADNKWEQTHHSVVVIIIRVGNTKDSIDHSEKNNARDKLKTF